MRPEEYARIVLRRWWLIPAIAIVAAAVAFVVTNRQPRIYNSSTDLLAVAQPPDYWMDLYAKNRLASYKKIVTDNAIAQRAVEIGQLDRYGLDAGAVMGKLAVAHDPDTNTVQIAASDTDPARAAAIVNAVAKAFIEDNDAQNARDAQQFAKSSGDPMSRVNIEQLYPATPAAQPSAPRPKLNAAAAAILGVALALVLIFALEYFDDTLRTAEDVRRYLDLPVLVGVPNGDGRSALGARRKRPATYGVRDAD
jgi:capsular polysaccharide biosynthesis protein